MDVLSLKNKEKQDSNYMKYLFLSTFKATCLFNLSLSFLSCIQSRAGEQVEICFFLNNRGLTGIKAITLTLMKAKHLRSPQT